MDEEKLNDFIGYVSAMLEKAFNTYLDEETLDRLYQSYSYKTDVSQPKNSDMSKVGMKDFGHAQRESKRLTGCLRCREFSPIRRGGQ